MDDAVAEHVGEGQVLLAEALYDLVDETGFDHDRRRADVALRHGIERMAATWGDPGPRFLDVAGGDRTLTPAGKEFTTPDIQDSRQIVAAQARERAPLVRTVCTAPAAGSDGSLRAGFFLDLRSPLHMQKYACMVTA